ncbi:MAG: aldo/keto reductase [Longimicrobiales bacterium]|nr:aldo/keto reductase [Longimicrobiales bacterium]
MEYRTFGTTDLRVSVVGFGAWAIGGPVMAGATPIGWGEADDETSRAALRRAFDLGVTFFDTADFYGLGRSETLIGEVFGNSDRVVVATKVGHRLDGDGAIFLDYSARHLRQACERSLARLRRDSIDLYQLHSARLPHLEQGECLEALERLREAGLIRHWGLSLNTFSPGPEADFLLDRGLGSGFQLVLNILNRRALPVVERARQAGVGVIARMALQFGLLAGAMRPGKVFAEDDHRAFRLSDEILRDSVELLDPFWRDAAEMGLTPTQAALGYAASVPGVSTVIPGIRTPEQAEQNAAAVVEGSERVRALVEAMPAEACEEIVLLMQERG